MAGRPLVIVVPLNYYVVRLLNYECVNVVWMGSTLNESMGILVADLGSQYVRILAVSGFLFNPLSVAFD